MTSAGAHPDMLSRTTIAPLVQSDTQILIDESVDFVRRVIAPILDKQPRLRVSPEEYAHTVKFLGAHRVTPGEMIPLIRQTISGVDELTLYAHLPVCRYRCTFCHYPVMVSQDARETNSYVDLLISESEIFRRLVPEVRDKRVTSLYFGGGTPTLVDNNEIIRLTEYFRTTYDLHDNAEITLEGTPETLTEEKIDALLEAGVTRVSVGVQSLNDALLALCHRDHTGDQAITAVQRLQTSNTLSVNVDLIYGLPGQKIEGFAEDVERVAQLRPTSVTIYRLRLERSDELKNTGMRQLYNSAPVQFPSFENCMAMQIAGRRILEKYGYIEHPSGWFSLPEHAPRVYDDRWLRQLPLIAFGWWTYSYAAGYEYHNERKKLEYKAKIEAGQLPIEVSSIFNELEKYQRYIQFQLKGGFEIDEHNLRASISRSSLGDTYYANLIDRLVAADLAQLNMGRLTLEPAGRVLVEEIIAKLLTPR